MSSKPSLLSCHPSPTYVFVVLSLAAFLTMFTFCRAPGINYEIQAAFFSTAMDGKPLSDQRRAELVSELRAKALTPEFVLAALRSAEMIRGDATPEMLKIGEEISGRMRVRMVTAGARHVGQFSLQTDHPQAGKRLLDSLTENLETTECFEAGSLVSVPSELTRISGGSITSGTLMALLIVASLVGQIGLMLTNRLQNTPVPYTKEEVQETTGLPVIAELVPAASAPKHERHIARRRRLKQATRVAEIGIAAVFTVMLYQFATRESMFARFVADPLAAYGEVLTRVIG